MMLGIEHLEILRHEQERRRLLRRYDWQAHARPSQRIPDGDWRVWLVMAGRGFGKTRTGAETVRIWSEAHRSIAIVGRTLSDARELMIDGPSGLLHVFPDWQRPEWVASRRLIRFPSGAKGHVFTSEEPDMLRGPQHGKAWADELAAWIYPQQTWDMLMFGLRLPPSPQVVVTTTPRAIPIMKSLVSRSSLPDDADEVRELGRVATTRGSTHENAENLDPAFLGAILNRYAGTRLGRQEIDAELIEDIEGSLWKRGMIVYRDPGSNDDGSLRLQRVVIGVDPAATSGVSSDETGIVAAGIDAVGTGFVIEDASLRASPSEWGSAAVRLFHRLKADRIVAEGNNGGDMVAHVIRTVDPSVPVKIVHASRGKAVRAEPIVARYEQNRVYHVKPLPALEDQMVAWVPTEKGRDSDADFGSPDRVDALVWALTEVLIGDQYGGQDGVAVV